MSSVELERWQALFPGAIDRGVVAGPTSQIRAEVRRMEKRGEIKAQWRYAKEVSYGRTQVPYVRYKTRRQVRIRQAKMAGVGVLLGAAALYGIGWLVWESRAVLLAGVLLIGCSMLLMTLGKHWSRGCSGLHCSGCRG